MTYKYKYITEDPVELGPILEPPEGGYKLTKIYVKDGKLEIEYENNDEEEN